MRKATAAAIAIGAVTTALALGGAPAPKPGRPATTLWYAALRKPAFVPPGPVFGLAWSALGVTLIYAGYRLLTAPPSRQRAPALGLWAANVASIAAWPLLFFGRKQLRASVALSAAMCAAGIGYIRAAAAVDPRAAIASLPFVGWLFFAFAMDEEVARRNTGRLGGPGDVVRRPLIAATARLS